MILSALEIRKIFRACHINSHDLSSSLKQDIYPYLSQIIVVQITGHVHTIGLLQKTDVCQCRYHFYGNYCGLLKKRHTLVQFSAFFCHLSMTITSFWVVIRLGKLSCNSTRHLMIIPQSKQILSIEIGIFSTLIK